MSDMFNGASSFDQNIAGWDVTTDTSFANMFLGSAMVASAGANADGNSGYVGTWFSNIITIVRDVDIHNAVKDWLDNGGITSGAYRTFGPISQWNTTQVTDMSGLFQNATGFNEDITTWDVSGVTDMNNMFNGASVFDQNISVWTVSSVTDMNNMFNNATSFNGAIGNWNVSNITSI